MDKSTGGGWCGGSDGIGKMSERWISLSCALENLIGLTLSFYLEEGDMSVVPPDVGLLSMSTSIISDVFTLFSVTSCIIANMFLRDRVYHYRVSFS